MGAIITVAGALAGMAFGRLISRIAVKAVPFCPIWCYFRVETIGAALLFGVA